MTDLTFKTRRLSGTSKYMEVQVKVDRTEVEMDLIGLAQAQSLLIEIDSFREDLLDFIKAARITNGGDL
jgi:hypothetical protein